ncbi:hypothetical protein ACJIZ3_013855 [Penstemon smallii]|uniref:Inositol polyphosphate-related phosphatase domain-containing protein n=1 Tax=Penstemon smallii TaxID=265156 RepID=A0ABD3RJT4_9LAMI
MSMIYDNWERLVAATLKRDLLRQLALLSSRESSFNSTATQSDFSYDSDNYNELGGDVEWRNSFSESEPSTLEKSTTGLEEKSTKNIERFFSPSRSPSRSGGAYLHHSQILNIQNYSVFVSTWNVGRKAPPSNMNLDDWLHSAPPADIYVLGFQEIVPLNAGNILGAEDNGPAKKWLSLIKQTLNNAPGTSGTSGGFSRLGSDEDFLPGNLPSTVLYSPNSYNTYAHAEDGYAMPGKSRYSPVASKQMVGIFLTVWIRSELTEHVKNIKVSCVGRGLMGYLGNKESSHFTLLITGSISISMLLHQTSICFVCSYLTSGQKEGDELRRNADVMEILRKTRFPKLNGVNDEKSPEMVLEHDRVIWLGDLNYRIALPYRSTKALVEMQNWRALLEMDQLRIEQRRGRVFNGWKEGKIYFPPTYKYSHNSDRYADGDLHPKEKRRTPAWCDRILWYGGGLQQLSYVRGESRFSEHRPVSSVFWAEVESVPNRLRKSMSCSSSKIEVEELLPYSHGYTELCFF